MAVFSGGSRGAMQGIQGKQWTGRQEPLKPRDSAPAPPAPQPLHALPGMLIHPS